MRNRIHSSVLFLALFVAGISFGVVTNRVKAEADPLAC